MAICSSVVSCPSMTKFAVQATLNLPELLLLKFLPLAYHHSQFLVSTCISHLFTLAFLHVCCTLFYS